MKIEMKRTAIRRNEKKNPILPHFFAYYPFLISLLSHTYTGMHEYTDNSLKC